MSVRRSRSKRSGQACAPGRSCLFHRLRVDATMGAAPATVNGGGWIPTYEDAPEGPGGRERTPASRIRPIRAVSGAPSRTSAAGTPKLATAQPPRKRRWHGMRPCVRPSLVWFLRGQQDILTMDIVVWVIVLVILLILFDLQHGPRGVGFFSDLPTLNTPDQ